MKHKEEWQIKLNCTYSRMPNPHGLWGVDASNGGCWIGRCLGNEIPPICKRLKNERITSHHVREDLMVKRISDQESRRLQTRISNQTYDVTHDVPLPRTNWSLVLDRYLLPGTYIMIPGTYCEHD
jgi:hypothetical protein